MEDSQPSDVTYVVHNSTLYLLLYAVVQLGQYLLQILWTNKLVKTSLLKYHRKIKKSYCLYTKSPEYQDISNQIENVQKKIKKYKKLIEANKKLNKNMNEYDLLILNGKYTRKILKEEKNINDLRNALEQENQGDYLFHTCDVISSLVTSTGAFVNIVRTQITVALLFLSLKYLSRRNAQVPYAPADTDLWFGERFKIVSTEPCAQNLVNLLYGYNTAHVVFLTLRQSLSSLFVKSDAKLKAA
ncbi:conserved Plasmodium protein, unknown function [Plasmodium vivax]|uniref:Uncharacterized protein n=6 Tax=Plasmodium vivax TaxID=5855 RepID=A5KAY7_PLAVS|nr:hypothetical protein, conserved [Plasmodium vivax]KMZ79888.1 hypothetical protein PVIIG_04144 [Plasmodium vivax India VII]KMZ86403.1 hypothetical protein PVBG_01924 [Plasmodium vivax Brazil I]KMZ92761.1 hypothetical protein PVMG_01348 [Plasmodium vivax Mauritania I]KNA02298.1 hypothetical protein PVNG_01453 [Plasmodium vivax North Korean]EDL43504.1 hypothetical protein, conserved [Plasmodium vivax]|eukprot:XP_001613231.1 hypothetical protein [Plasmodium vivax Sal-1]